MKFYLDVNIPYSALKMFNELNLEAVHARDVGHSRTDDKEVAVYARKNASILVRKDLEFANTNLFHAGSHEGLVIVRVPTFFNALQFIGVLKDFLSSIDVSDLKNSVAIVKVGRYRIRKLL